MERRPAARRVLGAEAARGAGSRRIEALEKFNLDTRLPVPDHAWWRANPLAMLRPEMDVAFVMSGGGNGRAVGGNPAAGDQRVADPSQQRHPGHPADGIWEMLDSRSMLHALVVGAVAVRPSTADCFGLIGARMGHQ